MSMSPGTYLRKRREAAGLQLDGVICCLAASPRRKRPVTGADLPQLPARLAAAESDERPLPLNQVLLLRTVFALDLDIYERLLLRHQGAHVPVPQVCQECACSFNDSCTTDHGVCIWTSHDSELCSACERRARLAASWPDAPLPEGETT